MTNQEITTKIQEVTSLLSSVYILALNKKGFLEKQHVTNEVIRVLEFNGITFMKYTHPAIDLVFANISKTPNSTEASNAWGMKIGA
tara:strand:- start:198 stop:455 length:258 start_codon:yes stop_codon:yes gene_type:complete